MSLSVASSREDIDHRQLVAQAHLVVVEVVRWGDFHAAGAELRIHLLVGDDRQLAPDQRQAHPPADQRAVALVAGMHRHGGVAEQRLRARRRHHHRAIAIHQRVAAVPQLPGLLLGDHLEVGDGGAQLRVPVDEALAAVDQPLAVQAHEDFPHRAREAFVHREALTRPVQRHAEAAHLAGDGTARFLFPTPDAFDEGLAPQGLARLAGALQLPLDHHLGGDAGVVGAALPQRAAPRACAASAPAHPSASAGSRAPCAGCR